MISRSCLQPRQCSPDAVLADHFLPGPGVWAEERRGEEGPPLSAPLSKQKKPRPRVSCLEPVQCESLVIRLGNIHYISFLLQKLLWKYIFFGSVIENLLNQIDRDLLWLCWPSLGWLPRPGCRAQAAAVKQSQAVSCPGPGAVSCLAPRSLCQIKWSSRPHGASGSRCILASQKYKRTIARPAAGYSTVMAERTFAENCCSISQPLGAGGDQAPCTPESCFTAKSVNGSHHHLSCPRLGWPGPG